MSSKGTGIIGSQGRAVPIPTDIPDVTLRTMWRNIEVTGFCWLWRGGKNRAGYGVMKIRTRSYLAHRVVFQRLLGRDPGSVLDHLCRVRNCVNPDHLEEVTHRENASRGFGPSSRSKTHCHKGHRFSTENTFMEKRSDGGYSRRCRKCHEARQARFKAKRGKPE